MNRAAANEVHEHEPLPPTLAWHGGVDGRLELLDQTLLPDAVVVLRMHDVGSVIDAIVRLAVRGAPAIGVAAAYGLVLGVRELAPPPEEFVRVARGVAARLANARPTAVNLQQALDRCLHAIDAEPTLTRLFAAAATVHADEAAMSARIGEHGRAFVRDGATVLTHCNAGRLATVGDGTALALLFAAWRHGTRFRVLADETRPLWQGARLTALELSRAGIPVDLLVDGAGPGLMARGEVQLVVVGADRIARNGDFANKVGTYPLALAAEAHGVPFVVAAPRTTFDGSMPDGASIPVEQRDANEVLAPAGRRIAPPGVGARNPAFDVTPARLVSAFVTDAGVLRPPFPQAIKALLQQGR